MKGTLTRRKLFALVVLLATSVGSAAFFADRFRTRGVREGGYGAAGYGEGGYGR